MSKHLISIKYLTKEEILEIFGLSARIKQKKYKFFNVLKGKTLGILFQKPSNRTRVSFAVGMYELGGYAVYLSPREIQLGVREAIKDVSCTLSRYLSAVVLRTFSHNDLLEFVRYSTIPVINGLTDLSHPCQALADIFTIQEKFKKLSDIKIAYVGDGNNVCHSLLYICAKLGINLSIATPVSYQPNSKIVQEAKQMAEETKSNILLFNYPKQAAIDADVIYTDVWVSMGQESEQEKRLKAFSAFQVNEELMCVTRNNCLVMHCLPAHRGQEITDDIIDGQNSIVFDQAENRLHVQKAILIKLLKP